jgi:hypothetical protein
MHRVIRDHLEEVLADSQANRNQDCQLHLRQCEECSVEIAAMRKQAASLRGLRTEVEPTAGFYARVMERIESQRVVSIWNVFSESPFGKRIAIASMALALLLGVYLVTSEQFVDQSGSGQPQEMISAALPAEGLPATNVRMVVGDGSTPDRDAVLVNLVTYREQ